MPVTQDSSSVETRLKGVALSPGVAIGRPCFYVRKERQPDSPPAPPPGNEAQRLRDALRQLARQRELLAEETATLLGPEHAAIFATHQMMLTDNTLQAQLVEAVAGTGRSAQEAVRQVLDGYKAQLSAGDSPYLRQRGADIDEIRQGLLGLLDQTEACRYCRETTDCSIGHCELGNDHILVGKEIAASLPVETDAHTTGFIVEKAGPDCHAVILARALRRPVVGNIVNLPDAIPARAELLVDGDRGEVIINPTAETLAGYGHIRSASPLELEASSPVAGLRVMANISLSGDVGEALAAGAEGVGLYRTEMELLVAGRLLSEDEQALRYSKVVTAMGGRPVCIRLLDLHNDKAAGWLPPLDGDTALHERNSHLLLSRPELLQAQARALARASVHGPVHVIYPMIVSVAQFRALRSLFEESIRGMPAAGLQHGVLFEVPAACLAATQIMEAADFGCIGTNDLIQYLFAVDRVGGDSTAHEHFENSGVLWELIADLSRAAARTGKPMAICGELAGNPGLTCRIMRCGISAISTSPTHVAGVRRAARNACADPTGHSG
jgi:phosphotransferase system enzyme I (PtsI)